MSAPLRLPRIFSDHLVLNHRGDVTVWGWGEPGRTVTVSYRDHAADSIVDSEGAWRCRFRELGPGPTASLLVSDGRQTVEIRDVVTGEVWLCGGQSNMEWPLSLSVSGDEALKSADIPAIRLLSIPHVSTGEPQADQDGVWSTCSPESARDFSAIGFFFGRVRAESGIPVGLINANWGASSAEAWIRREDLHSHPTLGRWLDETMGEIERALPAHTAWQAKADLRGGWMLADPGNAGEAEGFANPDLDDADWSLAPMGVRWSGFDPPLNINGAVWYRKEFELPDKADHPATLSLGMISDFETVYVNGVIIGQTSEEETGQALDKRKYTIPSGLLHAGPNVLAVRVFARIEEGGFLSAAEDLWLQPEGTDPVPLDKDWRYRIEFETATLGWPNWSCLDQCRPFGAWNGMIAPIVPFALTGVLWYQGESNTDRATAYRMTLELLIRSWRNRFERENLRFLIVQLANYGPRTMSPNGSNWVIVREAQWAVSADPDVATAVAIDLGEAGDIHPRRKLPVAERLAKAYEGLESGERTGLCSPYLVSSTPIEDGAAIELELSEPVTCLDRSQPLAFSVLNEDGDWEWAEATLSGCSVFVRSRSGSPIRAARYAWADNPETNLYSTNGLPLAPFRTDG